MSDNSGLGDAVCRDIDAAREELVALCGELVAAASVNPPGRTAEVADVVKRYLVGHGIAPETVKADDEAPNVVGSVAGRAPAAMSCSTPTWTRWRPATRRPGACRCAAHPPRRTPLRPWHGQHERRARRHVPRDRGPQPPRANAWNGRLTMTAVSDEVMFGERGTVFLLRERPDLAGDFLISGEGPGFMGFAVAEKGLLWLDIEARGRRRPCLARAARRDRGHAACGLAGASSTR